MGRLLQNPKQTADAQIYYDNNHVAITIPKEGYWFSDDEAMDETVNWFIEELGFKQVNKEAVKKPSKMSILGGNKKDEEKTE